LAAHADAPAAAALPPPAAEQPATPAMGSPAQLPGKGILQYDFLYAGEWDTRKAIQTIKIVRKGKVVWSYSLPLRTANGHIQEFDDATRLSNGDVVFSRMQGAGKLSPEGKLIWNYDAPPGTEIHSIQPLGTDRVAIMQNGNPAKALIINTVTSTVEKEVVIPTTTTGTHGQFRHMRVTAAGTILVGHMSLGKVSEYDMAGKEIWSVPAQSPWAAVRLKNGNTLISGDRSRYVREVDPKGQTVWELTQADIPDYVLGNIQEADRLANGDTMICNWIAGDNNHDHWPGTVQVLEVNPAKKVVWALRSWTDPDLGPSSSIQILSEPGIPENGDLQR
jgi:hypothetical protein